MESTNVAVSKLQIMELVQNTAPERIGILPEVKERFIKNYNLTHKGNQGEIAYHKQLMNFTAIIKGNKDIACCSKESLYKVFITAAVKGWSLDAQDNEIYLIPRNGICCYQQQTKALIKRLLVTKQIKSAESPKLVYLSEKNTFKVVNGLVVNHEETFDIIEDDKIIAGYIKFILPSGKEKHIIYKKSDWESWKAHSPQPNGGNWNYKGQPKPGFLRTKIAQHAAKDNSWMSGMEALNAEVYDDLEIDEDIEIGTKIESKAIAETIYEPEIEIENTNNSETNQQKEEEAW